MEALLSSLRRSGGLAREDTRAALLALAPSLSLTGRSAEIGIDAAAPVDVAAGIAGSGYASLGAVTTTERSTALAVAVARLVDAGLPSVFVYLFDEPWALGEAVAVRASAALGARYRVVEDIWAWQIPRGGHGWPAHRGIGDRCLSRERPELLNTWVALDDVESDRACMHFVPLDDDAAYPEALTRIDAPPNIARAAPLAAGDALAWNANILHWGGACASTARGPRISCSFSLVRADAAATLGFPLANGPAHDLAERLDALARQLVVYGAGQPDVLPPVLEWARAAVALQRLTRR